MLAHARPRYHRAAKSLGWLLAAFMPTVHALTLDDVDVSRQAGRVTATVHFDEPILYRSHVVTADRRTLQLELTVPAVSTTAIEQRTLDVESRADAPAMHFRFTGTEPGPSSPARLVVTWDEPVEIASAGQGEDAHDLRIVLSGGEVSHTPIASSTTPANDLESALAQAEAALAAGQPEKAVSLLNRVLNLPPNAASERAQALIGDARAALGEEARARSEYQLYLKLYPNGPDSAHIRSKLKEASVASATQPSRDKSELFSVWGSLGEHYYGGQSQLRNETTIVTPATDARTLDIQNISTDDQSAFATDVDANARYRGEHWDVRAVVRNVYVYSLLNTEPSRNRLSALYVDVKHDSSFDMRLGRQTATALGSLGRFDGLSTHIAIGDDWRLGLVGGLPTDDSIGKSSFFYGATLEADQLLPNTHAAFFAVERRTEGYTDSRTVGTEIRYADENTNVLAWCGYDLSYKTIDVCSLQGGVVFDSRATATLLYDYRRSPSIRLTNALLGSTFRSIEELKALKPIDQIQADADALTPTSEVMLLNSTVPLSDEWQVGAEVRRAVVSSTPAVGDLPASVGSGNVYAYTLQVIGTGVLSEDSVFALNVGRLQSDANNGWLSSLNARFRPLEHFSLEPSMRYYQQEANNGTHLQRLAPMLRMTYRLGEAFTLETEVSLERSHVTSDLTNEKSDLLFYYTGFQWTF